MLGWQERMAGCSFATRSLPSDGIPGPLGRGGWQYLPPIISHGAVYAAHIGIALIEQMGITVAHVELQGMNAALLSLEEISGI